MCPLSRDGYRYCIPLSFFTIYILNTLYIPYPHQFDIQMGNITQCCDQSETQQNPIPLEHQQDQQFLEVKVAETDQKFQEQLARLQQQEEFRDFCANKALMKHRDKDEYYFGDWVDGIRKGRALIYRPNHYLYYGQVDRVPEGQGLIRLYTQNLEIEGQMRAGRPNGVCHIRDLGGVFTFEGTIQDEAPKQGRFQVKNHIDPDKSYYIVLENYPANPARIYFKDGSQYEGQISLSALVPHGEGLERYANNTTYKGGWENGQYHGHGRFTWPDGSSYNGEYLHGIKQGTGTYIYKSKKQYNGEWVNGKQEGRGALFSPEGKLIKKGLWEGGVYQRELSELEREAQKSELKKEEERKKVQEVEL